MSPSTYPRVTVVGAGVSGCACALAAAEAGVAVLLLNSSLDSVGMPAYGPALWGGGEVDAHAIPAPGPSAAVEALVSAAPGLAHSWLRHARLPMDGSPVLLIDRRSVSLETKWRLENEPLVQLRQAIVTSVTRRSDGAILIGSAFGEEWEADVVVLAVGLALGGRTSLGGLESPGGRYGEVAADLLLENLAAQGVSFREEQTTVGARLGRRPGALDLEIPSGAGRMVSLAGCCAEGVTQLCGEHPSSPDFTVLPPSPYEAPFWSASDAVLVAGPESAIPFGPKDLVLAPDGIATGEWYLHPETDEVVAGAITSADGWWSAEPPHIVRGHIAVGDGDPREVLDAVWVVGQVAGAGSYVGSLRSGWRLGRELGRLRRPLGEPPLASAESIGSEELGVRHTEGESGVGCSP